MSRPALKTLVWRWPAASPTQSLVRCCHRLPLAAAARPVCLAQTLVSVSRPFSSTKSIFPTSARRSLLPTSSPARPRSTHASSPIASAARLSSSAAHQASPEAEPGTAKLALDWNSFFKLRLRRRRIQLFFSVTSGLLGGAVGALFLSTGFAEPLVMQIPLDPFVTLGLLTLACAAMGWLAGPSIGSQVFYLANRRYKAQMMEKESEFFTRVKKNRVDPSNSSAGNPVPDFYGEKIQSVSGYRQWLKDQRAFNKKKTANFV